MRISDQVDYALYVYKEELAKALTTQIEALKATHKQHFISALLVLVGCLGAYVTSRYVVHPGAPTGPLLFTPDQVNEKVNEAVNQAVQPLFTLEQVNFFFFLKFNFILFFFIFVQNFSGTYFV